MKARHMDPPDLGDKMPALRLDRYLDVALNCKDTALLQIITLQHPVHTVLCPVRLRTAFNHLFPNIDNLIQQ